MKIQFHAHLLLVVICLFVAISSTHSIASEDNFDAFMAELKKAPGVITAFREYTTLWVQVPGTLDFQVRGQEFADMILAWYLRDVGHIGCVRVFYGNRRTIGRACNTWF